MTKRKITYSDENDPTLKKLFIQSIEFATGRRKLEKILNEILALDPEPNKLWQIMREKLDLSINIDQNKLDKIPRKGSLIFIANHPFGVIDGIVFGEIINSVRPKFKFLVNEALCKEEKLNEYFLPIDFRDTKEAIRTNIESRRVALEYLKDGHSIAIFPGGGVSTSPSIWEKATDLEWKRFVAKLIKKANASVIPIFFHGSNSFIFQLLSIMSMDLRVALLLNEVRNKIGATINVSVGDLMTYESIMEVENQTNLLAYLRDTVYSLKKSSPE